MIAHRIRGLQTLQGIIQVAVLSLAYWVTFGAFCALVSPGTALFINRYFIFWAVLTAGFVLELLMRGPGKLTAPIYDSSLLRQAPVAFRQVAFAFGGLLFFLFLTKEAAISRTFLFAFAAVLYPAIVWSNAYWPARLSRALFRGSRKNGTLLVGDPRSANRLNFWLERKKHFGVNVLGVITTDSTAIAVPGEYSTPVIGSIEQLEPLLENPDISQVILLELGKPDLARRLIAFSQRRGFRLLIINDFAEMLGQPVVSCIDEGVNILTLHEEPLENPFNRVLKRVLDFTLAMLVTILVLPWLSLLVWLVQRRESPGPLLYKQLRAGFQNHTFTIYKFRSMYTDGGEAGRQASANDERIFPAGRWLRRFSLDEMPQFLNVLRGEMSIVGPRPHLVEHNRLFAEVLEGYHFRTFIKPGITGLAQVRGFRGEARTREDLAARLKSDMIYLENWSLGLDLAIIARTIWQMLRPPKTAV
jgi:putative colanic acid biosynthesis UDP-glucose lipid carrier transferase